MKKTSLWCIVFVLLLSIIIIYTSCGVEMPTKSVAHSEQVLENNLKEESISALSPYLVTTCTGIFNNQVTGTDKGSYILLQNSKGEYNIFYVDYLTQQIVYLSSEPQSLHNEESDTSYLGECPGGASLFCTSENLYVVVLGSAPSSNVPSEPTKIIKMDLNGANRSTLYTFSDEYFLENTAFAFDGELLYFLAVNVDTGLTEIVCLATNTGVFSSLLELEHNSSSRLLGTTSDGLVLQQTTFSDENARCKLQVFSLQTNSIRTVNDFKYSDRSYVISHEKAYSFSPSDGKARVLSLKNGEEDILNDKVFSGEDSTGYMLVGDIYDNHFFVLDKNTNDLYAIKCTDGTVTPITLQEEGFNASIMAQSESDFLILKKYEEKSYIGNDPNGNLEKQSLMLPVYALINKKSYWSSTPDFRIIQLKNFNIQ